MNEEKKEDPLMSKIIKGKERKPPRICIYGEHGIGKSTFASQFPDPIFIQTEDGLNQIDCEKFPLATDLMDVVNYVQVLKTSEHNYKTLVLDSLDWLEKLAHEYICTQEHRESISSFDRGAGYVKAKEKIIKLLKSIDELRIKKKMIICFLSHSTIYKFEDPCGTPYDRYKLAVSDSVNRKIMEWCDVVSFLNFETKVLEDAGNFKKAKRAVNRGRFLYSISDPAYDAKNRYNMPDKMPLDVKEFFKYIKGN